MARPTFSSLKNNKKRGRRIAGPVLKVLLSTLLCLLLLECYFRIFQPQTGLRRTRTAYLPPCFKYDPLISWTLYPGVAVLHRAENVFGRTIPVRINSKGFRNEEFPVFETPGRRRIIALGDSFVFGLGVLEEECLTAQLEKILGRASCRVINAGYAGGMAQDTMYLALKTRILDYHPHLLLLFYFEGNDLHEMSLSTWPETDERNFPLSVETAWNVIEEQKTLWMGRHMKELSGPVRFFKFWADHSHLGRFLYVRYRQKAAAAEREAPAETAPGGLVLKALSRGQREDVLIGLVREMARLCRNAGTEMAVVMIPDMNQTADQTCRQTNPRIREALETSGIPTLDLLEHWPRGPHAELLFFPGDRFGHWNPAGHRQAAELIAAFINPG
jgi:hypothetical protein